MVTMSALVSVLSDCADTAADETIIIAKNARLIPRLMACFLSLFPFWLHCLGAITKDKLQLKNSLGSWARLLVAGPATPKSPHPSARLDRWTNAQAASGTCKFVLLAN